ncbi:hypothetical protein [Arthrobacter sp. 24S4-2]|uniref:hypothetical protein n=1 Tax=Arthrobacter sp. 24S4-2 TaxID=2575374 RepID=UPI0020C805A0|nr:hypothetical protein [Arthrobacter sp. 24S4-2]
MFYPEFTKANDFTGDSQLSLDWFGSLQSWQAQQPEERNLQQWQRAETPSPTYLNQIMFLRTRQKFPDT